MWVVEHDVYLSYRVSSPDSFPEDRAHRAVCPWPCHAHIQTKTHRRLCVFIMLLKLSESLFDVYMTRNRSALISKSHVILLSLLHRICPGSAFLHRKMTVIWDALFLLQTHTHTHTHTHTQQQASHLEVIDTYKIADINAQKCAADVATFFQLDYRCNSLFTAGKWVKHSLASKCGKHT